MASETLEDSGRKVPGAASARKLLSVLLCFSIDRPFWTVPDLSRALDVSLSTMYRYVALLREVGLLEPVADNAYRLTGRIMGLARAAERARSSLEEVSLPIMTRLRDATNETVLIARRNRDHAYCLERVESLQPVRLQFERGQPMSLHRGALARVLLANAPGAERERYLEAIQPGLSGKAAEILKPENLDKIAETGFTVSFEEVDEGIWGTAAAIRRDDEVVAALGIAAPIYRLDGKQRDFIVAEVRRAAAEISEMLESS
ncbi:MAG: IclR family transcriptional regulator [Rhizobiales bacterium]|nr:IclR family transcriptional regulator [Hyphomicrobiales bacterium]